MLKEKHVELLWTPDECSSATGLAFEPKFYRLCFFFFSVPFSVYAAFWEARSVVSLLSQALCQLHPFPLLYILITKMNLKPKTRISTLAHICISESTSSASASHI